MRRYLTALITLVVFVSYFAFMGEGCSRKEAALPAGARGAVEKARTDAMPVMLDIGSTHCVPCIQMMPVLDALEKKYKGRMAVIFVDVEKEREYAGSLGVTMIPTQIFYDRDGTELKRHYGFLAIDDAEKIISGILH